MSRTPTRSRNSRESTPPSRIAGPTSRQTIPESAPPPPLAPPNPAGKYALLEVPAFAKDPEHGAPMTSFVRLGVPNRHHELDGGSDLLSTAKSGGWASDLVDTRGGLRDHSDGDRISTTRGHKIDVISGNYKKVLASDKASGGSVREDHAHENGVLALNTKKANVIERNVTHGERYESFTGPKLERNTGVSKGSVINDKILKQVQLNTAQAEQECQPPPTSEGAEPADEETSSSGAESTDEGSGPMTAPPADLADAESGGDVTAAPEQEISIGNTSELNAGLIMNSQTFALQINDTTAAGLTTSQTLVGRAESMTLAGSMIDTTWAGEIHSVTAAMLLAEATTAAVSTSVTNIGVINEATLAGVILSDTKAGSLFESTIIPLQNSLNIGDSIDLRLGNQLGIAGPTAIEIWTGAFTEVFVGVALSFRLAASAEITVGAGAELFAGATAEVFLGAKLDVTFGLAVEYSKGGELKVSELTEIKVSTVKTKISNVKKDIAAALHLGS